MASGGSQLKYKFHATASCVVTGRNHRQSVELALMREDGLMAMSGNVAVPPNHAVPEAETVVEVRYLYAFRDSGALFQPVFLGPCDDIAPEKCTIDQLKHKAAWPSRRRTSQRRSRKNDAQYPFSTAA
jgi:bifunctional non-homologous end joining protein LigD